MYHFLFRLANCVDINILLQSESLERDIIDIQSEFQFERIDYLDTIRKQERQLLLLEGLLDKIHPCLRRDCNYANIDKVKKECKWEDDAGKWIFPRMQISNTALPVAGNYLPCSNSSVIVKMQRILPPKVLYCHSNL